MSYGNYGSQLSSDFDANLLRANISSTLGGSPAITGRSANGSN